MYMYGDLRRVEREKNPRILRENKRSEWPYDHFFIRENLLYRHFDWLQGIFTDLKMNRSGISIIGGLIQKY